MFKQDVSRRAFLAASAAASWAMASPYGALRAALADPPMVLRARPGNAQLLDPGQGQTPIWGYGGHVPGPVIRVRRGDQVNVRLENRLPQPTTIHWHGIRIDNAMDGVAGLTQDPVAGGAGFDYRFRAPDAGTYWYHPHNRSWEQLARGLYGVLIVEEPDPPKVDQDLVLIVDDWLLESNGSIDEKRLGSVFDRSHAGRLGNTLTLNGKPFLDIPVVSGQRIRLRVCNTANARIMKLRLEDVAPQVIAYDGQPISP